MLASVANQNRVRDALRGALLSIEGDQLDTGEIPNYRKLENGTWEYHFSPLVSAYVADALAIFDPLSRQFDPFLVEQAGGRWRVEVSHSAARIRRRIRRFLAWQQSADGTWRFLGRGSSLPPDRDTTACCALVLLDRIGVNSEAAAKRLEPALRRLRESAGLSSRSHSCDAAPEWDEVLDWIASINVLRFAILACGDAEPLAQELARRYAEPGLAPVVSVLYVLGAARRQCGLPGFEPVRSSVVDALIQSQTPEGTFGGALATAMGLTALLDFGYAGPEIESAAGWLQSYMDSSSAGLTEAFCGPLCGSPAFARAVAIGALSRASL